MRPNSAAADWPRTRELPTAIYAVVARLQALEQHGDALTSQIPRVRLRTRSGQWLVLHASRMSGPALPAPIAVILEIAQAVEIAPLIIQAYDLSKREGEITLCVVRGLSTAEIASELNIWPTPSKIISGRSSIGLGCTAIPSQTGG